MRFLSNLIQISDVFFISQQLKQINSNYEIFYNTLTRNYEVHDTGKYNSFVISFSAYPNQNLIRKLHQSNAQNIQKIFKEIEENNKQLQDKNHKNLTDKSNQMLSEIFSYSQKTSGDLSKNLIKKIIEKG